MSEDVHFNLVDEPWIRVRDMRGISRELSLWDLFACAGELKCLANDLPTQNIAILRLLLAILQRSLSPSLDEDDDPAEVWARLWEADTLPVEEIHSYLEKWRHRFDLLDKNEPFMQIAGLVRSNDAIKDEDGEPYLKRVIADVPSRRNRRLFSVRMGEGINRLSYAEAARWLIHVHSFDTGGPKNAAKGDSSDVIKKEGRSYPGGTGWLGRIGCLYFEGSTIKETLILNFVPLYRNEIDSLFPENDLPIWERRQRCVSDGHEPRVLPDGRADLYTWQSRWVNFSHEDGMITNVVLSAGDLLSVEAVELYTVENMTSWKEGTSKSKSSAPKLIPVHFDSDKALWRGLNAIFAQNCSNKNPACHLSGTAVWLRHLSSNNGGRAISKEYLLNVHAVDFKYNDSQSSSYHSMVDDKLEMSSYLLSPEGAPLVNFACGCVEKTEEAVKTLGSLAVNLYLASGGDSESSLGVCEAAKSRAFFEIDRLFRVWFSALGSQTNAEAARAGWYAQLRDVLMRLAQELIGEAGPAAVRGSQLKNKKDWMTAGKAEARFYATLDCILSCGSKEEKVKEG